MFPRHFLGSGAAKLSCTLPSFACTGAPGGGVLLACQSKLPVSKFQKRSQFSVLLLQHLFGWEEIRDRQKLMLGISWSNTIPRKKDAVATDKANAAGLLKCRRDARDSETTASRYSIRYTD